MKSFEQAKSEDDTKFGRSDWEALMIEEIDGLSELARKRLLDESAKNLVASLNKTMAGAKPYGEDFADKNLEATPVSLSGISESMAKKFLSINIHSEMTEKQRADFYKNQEK